jgi:hypothetical protein
MTELSSILVLLTFLQEISELEEEKLDTCLVNKLRNEFTGVLTGRNFFGGSLIRPEATGYRRFCFAL